ncbi:MAG: purine-binding chemotaxis protein CheW [Leptospiraceae bacterium]|nr:purine-binding chemotaxis protein CheW [Leptospiraceae bacterium]
MARNGSGLETRQYMEQDQITTANKTALLLQQAGESEIDHGTLQFLLFRVQNRYYGIDILEIHEILKPVPVTRLPNVRPDVLGVINLRGNIIPVIDLHKKFFDQYTELNPGCRIIVGTCEDKNIGLLVAGISEVARIHAENLEARDMEGVSARHIRAVGRSNDKVFLIINLAVLYQKTEVTLAPGSRPALTETPEQGNHG